MHLFDQLSEVISGLIGFVIGAGGTLVAVRFTRSNQADGDGNAVDQSNAKSGGGDITGRDKIGS